MSVKTENTVAGASKRGPGRPKKIDPPAGADTNEDERLRMTVDFPPATTRRLRMLKEKLEAPSYVDVLRTALRLLEVAVEAKQDGGDVVVIKDGKERSIDGLAA